MIEWIGPIFYFLTLFGWIACSLWALRRTRRDRDDANSSLFLANENCARLAEETPFYSPFWIDTIRETKPPVGRRVQMEFWTEKYRRMLNNYQRPSEGGQA